MKALEELEYRQMELRESEKSKERSFIVKILLLIL